MTPHAKASRSAGFTLIELLIGVVVSGILAGVILQLVTGQARTTGIQFARQEVRENTRSALELMASELRGVSSIFGGVVYAGSDTIQIRTPIAWGIYCDRQSGQTLARFDNTVWSAVSPGLPSSFGVALQTVASPETYSYTDGVTQGTLGALGACATMNADAATSVKAFSGVSTSGPTPAIGNSVYLYRSVAYGDGVSGSSNVDRWMTRGVFGAAEPLAGPVESLRFRYLNSAGDTIATPVADPTQIRSIRVIIAMKARYRSEARHLSVARSQDSVTVSLRNFR